MMTVVTATAALVAVVQTMISGGKEKEKGEKEKEIAAAERKEEKLRKQTVRKIAILSFSCVLESFG